MDVVSTSQSKSYSPANTAQAAARLDANRDETLKKAEESRASEQAQSPKPGVEVTLSSQVVQTSESANTRNERGESRTQEAQEVPQANANFSKAASLSTAQEGQRQIDELV
ncbi:MAG: hypothetical protein H6999_02915 [Hahellaceae bacterium]|nr:hypothetical protein [Hahellaceae bacterium]MCP5168695.1 hypothetical protein [Hahellaceae bacterium]